MKNLKLRKLVAIALAVMTIATVSPIGASAAWKQDSNGWWNTEEDSWSTNWRKIDSTWYNFGSDGYMKTDWANVDGTWYYLNPVSDGTKGAMKTAWQNVAGVWYYLNPVSDGTQGAMKTGWINDNGVWYFASSSGAMQTGVIQINGKVYYFAANGAMQTGNVTINGVVYTFAATGEAIGDNIPTPTLAFNSDGTPAEIKTPDTTTTTGTSSGGGGGSHHSSGGGSAVADPNDKTSSISTLFTPELTDIMTKNPTLKNYIDVDLTANPIAVTLKNSNLDSLQNIFNAKNEPLDVIETRLTKAEVIMNTTSSMLSVGGKTFTKYLADADANYVAKGGNSNYYNPATGRFNTTAIAEKINSNTLTYDEFKTNLADRIAGMSKAATSPVVTVTVGGMQVPVTKIQVDGKSTPIYDTTKSVEDNAKGLVDLAEATKGTYTIYTGTGTGTSYFKMKIS